MRTNKKSKKAMGKIKKDEVTVAYITGNGLKTMEAMGDFVDPIETPPSSREFETALKHHQNKG